MKKLLLPLALVVVAFPAFAQEEQEEPEGWDGTRRMAVTMSLTPLLLGATMGGFGVDAGFEYALTESFSMKANVRFISIDPLRFDIVYAEDGFRPRASQLRFNLEGRWYPRAQYVQGWFLNGNLQYQRLFATSSLTVDDEELATSINAFSAFVGLGYKAIFRSSHRHAFIMEPLLDVGWRIASDSDLILPLDQMLGMGGVRFRLLFGVAF